MTPVPKSGAESVTTEGCFTAVARRAGGKRLYAVDHASTPAAAK